MQWWQILLMIFFVAIVTAGIYLIGIIKSQNKQRDLMNSLYLKGESRVMQLLKTGPKTEEELAKQLEKLQACLFYSKTKIRVTDARLFTKTLLDTLMKKQKIQKGPSGYTIRKERL